MDLIRIFWRYIDHVTCYLNSIILPFLDKNMTIMNKDFE